MRHLSDGEISGWMLGDRTAIQSEHVAGCRECRESIHHFESAIQSFRDGAVAWSALRQPAAVVAAPPQWWLPRPGWGLAIAALMLLSVFPVYQGYSSHVARAHERARLAAAEDSALLSQVDTEISRAVPAPMEPLVTLVGWKTSDDETNKGTHEIHR